MQHVEYIITKEEASPILVAGYYTLVVGAVLSNFNLSIQYPVFALLSINFFAFYKRESISYLHLAYLLIFSVSYLVHILFFPFILNKLLFSTVYYLIIPFIYGNNNISANQIYKSLKLCTYSSFLGIVGLAGQMSGFLQSFKMEITDTLGEVHARYTSFFGSSILFGFISAINAVVLFYSLITAGKLKLNELFLFFASVACMIFSYTRGAYLIFIVGVLTISALHLEKVKKAFKFTFIIIVLMLVFSLGMNLDLFLTRLGSFFDFKNEGGNVERLLKWMNAIKIFLNNFWVGTAPGSTGSVGVSKEDAWEYANSYGVVTESYVLKVFVENGVFVGIFFMLFYLLSIYKAFKFLNHPEKKLLLAIFIAIVIESFTLQSLESPLISMIFWICFSSLVYNKEELNNSKMSNFS